MQKHITFTPVIKWGLSNERPIRWNIGLQFLARGLSISHEIRRISWNPPDFMKSSGFHVKSSRFHEIPGHSPHLAFIKLKSFCWNTCFYNFGWIWQVISGWNPPDFTGEIRRISRISWNPPDFRVKSAGFHGFHEIRRISWWNPPDFMNVSFCVMIKYRSFYRKTKKGARQKRTCALYWAFTAFLLLEMQCTGLPNVTRLWHCITHITNNLHFWEGIWNLKLTSWRK